MIPTLAVGDHIFVSKFSYGLSIPFTDTKILQYAEPKRGDVIVFKWPNDHSIDYIKRVVGLPGDVIEMKQEELYINGKPVPRERLPRALQRRRGAPQRRAVRGARLRALDGDAGRRAPRDHPGAGSWRARLPAQDRRRRTTCS